MDSCRLAILSEFLKCIQVDKIGKKNRISIRILLAVAVVNKNA